jgi:hypothetical protein
MSDDIGGIFQKPSFLTALTVTTGMLAGINTLSITLALSPFWLDFITGAACLSVAAGWIKNIMSRDNLAARYFAARALGAGPVKAMVHSSARPHQFLLWLMPALLLVASLSFLSAPIHHLLRPKWSLCGTFITRCENSCLVLLDDRRRDILGRCLLREDDSGYRHVETSNFWTYQPSSVSVECDGKVGATAALKPQMFSNKCEGVWKE